MENLIPPITSVYILLGIVFVFALLGLLVAILMEIVSAFLNLRGKAHLHMLRELLGNESLFHDFLRHPLYQQLLGGSPYRRRNVGALSYLSSRNFAQILMDIFDHRGLRENDRNFVFSENTALNEYFRKAYAEHGQYLPAFRSFLERWYNEKADYVSGSYRRIVKNFLFATAVCIAILFNADIGGLYARIASSVDSPKTTVLNDVTNNLEKLIRLDSSLQNTATVQNIKENLLNNMDAALQQRNDPILGYYQGSTPQDTKDWLFWLFGILVTALATAFAAEVWFEWLKKWMGTPTSQVPVSDDPPPPPSTPMLSPAEKPAS